MYPFSIAQVTLTGPASVAHKAAPVTFTAQIADGENPVGDPTYTVTFDVLDSSNTVVASASAAPNASSGIASAAVDLSALPAGTYPVRANLDRPWVPKVLVRRPDSRSPQRARPRATGSEPLVPSVIAVLLLLGGAAVLVARRRTA